VNNLAIEQIRPEMTWRLRRDVLYTDQPIQAMQMDEDWDGLHFGAFYNNQLVAVVSLFENGTDFQFRKFAVLPAVQGQGIGSSMLRYITDFVIIQQGIRLWCNARTTAISFYEKAGFIRTGKKFSKSGFDYEIMEQKL